jgi:hypothetical protein
VASGQLAEAGADQEVTARGATAPTVEWGADQAEVVAPPVQALAQEPAGEVREPCSLGEHNAVAVGQVLGDPGARVGGAHHHHHHIAAGDLIGIVVVGAVHLGDVVAQALGDRGYMRLLVGAGGHDHLRRLEGPRGGVEPVAPGGGLERVDLGVEPDGQRQGAGVGLEVVGHLVLAGKVLGMAGKRNPGRVL